MDIEPVRDSSLELEEALPMQRLFWRLEWVLLAVILVVMALSLAGMFGGGWLAQRETVAGDLTVRYERFVRVDLTTILEVELSGRELAIDADYFADFALERVVPAPSVQRARDGELVFGFETGGDSPYTVRFYLTPGNPLGTTETVVRADDARVAISHFTFP